MTLLHRTRKVVFEAGKQYGSALEDVEDNLRTDHNMVMRQSGRAPAHTGLWLHVDLKIVLAAVHHTRHASQHRLHSALASWSLGQLNRDGLEFQSARLRGQQEDVAFAFIARDKCIATWAVTIHLAQLGSCAPRCSLRLTMSGRQSSEGTDSAVRSRHHS